MMNESEGGLDLCAFCRTPPPSSDEEVVKRVKELMKNNKCEAFTYLGGCYFNGAQGLPQDYQKANKLYLMAGELGCAKGYYNLGMSYENGKGVKVDKEKKAKHYYELAAMMGHEKARANLSCNEWEAGNRHRAFKHLLIAARAGVKLSLDVVKQGFMDGFVTKDEYADTLRAYHERQNEMKSDARDKAAASGLGLEP